MKHTIKSTVYFNDKMKISYNYWIQNFNDLLYHHLTYIAHFYPQAANISEP